jgi:hypothetical protein
VIKFCHHTRRSIQWLYLCHCFLHAYFALRQLPPKPQDNPPFTVPSADYVLLQINKISTRIDSELQALHDVNRYLDAAISVITLADSISCTSSHSLLTMTSNRSAMNISKSGPSAQPVPAILDVCKPLPSSPLAPRNSDDTNSG